jgi:hypothetical protein
VSQRHELLDPEGRGDRNGAIVDCQRTPPKDPSRHRKKTVSQRVTLQIEQKQCPACEWPQRCDQVDCFAAGEVMQDGRTKNEVEGARSEGKLKSVRHDSWGTRFAQMELPVIHRDDRGIPKIAGQTPAHIARTGAYIQERERLQWLRQFIHDPE